MIPHRSDPEGAEPDVGLLDGLLRGSRTLCSLQVDGGGTVQHANQAFADLSGRSADAVRGLGLTEVMTAPDAARVSVWAAAKGPPPGFTLLNFLGASDSPFSLRCLARWQGHVLLVVGERDARDEPAADELMRVNNAFATQSRELSRQTRELTRRTIELEKSREETLRALHELQAATAHLRRIQQTVPICMRCNQVKSGADEWESLLQYLRSNRIQLSHGYCPNCYDAVAREFGLEDELS